MDSEMMSAMAGAESEGELVVKVIMTENNSQRSLRFNPETTVEQQVQLLKKKLGLPDTSDYVLFIPDQKKVMLPDKTVESYHLEKVELIEMRPRLSIVAVKMLDGSVKKMRLDVGGFVSDLMSVIGEKVGLQISDEFGLQCDNTNDWLSDTLPLLEQWKDGQVLALRKRFFMDDKNVTKEDPMKLHLYYTEAATNVTQGSIPVTIDEATELASLQLQVEKGDCDGDIKKYSSEFLRQYLPPQYRSKNLDKPIYNLWKRLVRTQLLDAKLRYFQFARSLKTWGITVFEVREKVPGSRKLQSGLLGISSQSVVRMASDKSIVQDWPLRQIKRWAAGDGVFTLDFGNHSGEYYMVFTKEGERMSAMLSGYIDLLLKKRRDTGRGEDADALEVATAEDVASALAVRAVATVGRQQGAVIAQTKKTTGFRRRCPSADREVHC